MKLMADRRGGFAFPLAVADLAEAVANLRLRAQHFAEGLGAGERAGLRTGIDGIPGSRTISVGETPGHLLSRVGERGVQSAPAEYIVAATGGLAVA